MKTEKEKMIAGELYNALDPELSKARRRARELLKPYNDSRDDEADLRARILKELFGASGKNLWIEPPFFCDYGSNIFAGENVYFNFNCVVLDVAEVHIGSNVFCAPNVQIYTATHPLDFEMRRQGVQDGAPTSMELGAPISIGDDVWIGGGAILLPGVSIGARSVIGAGSVVTKDVPPGVLAVGNPCRILRDLN